MARDMGVSPRGREVEVPSGKLTLKGFLAVPENAIGIVLFAHGSGSGRFSPRNNHVAGVLQDQGIATLLIDLLTEQESQDRRLVFDIDLLTRRLLDVTAWLRGRPETSALRMGYFGASTGAAAALRAAALEGDSIGAVVSRGGRPDLAMNELPRVTAPTLLIVGERDDPVVDLNRMAHDRLPGVKEMVVVLGATHLFEEAGALEDVARLAADWFSRHLPKRARKAA